LNKRIDFFSIYQLLRILFRFFEIEFVNFDGKNDEYDYDFSEKKISTVAKSENNQTHQNGPMQRKPNELYGKKCNDITYLP
jgi:hypothetical protein